MGNLITYVQQYEAQTFQEKPLTDIDILVLTEIAYLPFDKTSRVILRKFKYIWTFKRRKSVLICKCHARRRYSK